MIIFADEEKSKDMEERNDTMGAAIADYHEYGKAERLRVFAKDFE